MPKKFEVAAGINTRPISEVRIETPLYAAIEAGGTKFICSIAHDVDNIVAERQIPTGNPSETLGEVSRFLAESKAQFGALQGIGVAAFGPVDLDRRSSDYGRLRGTPKNGWSHVSFLEPILDVHPDTPIAIDTDVNAAALAEVAFGAARGCTSAVYVTVGTGIGGGALVAGKTLHGILHPEMGHIFVRRHPHDKGFAGICPFHGDCLEGLASGPAVLARWEKTLSDFDRASMAHRIVGHYLGQLAATVALMIAPQKIVFGGGVMKSASLLQWVRGSMEAMLAGYHQPSDSFGSIEDLVCLSELDGRAGLIGALLLAKQAAVERATSGNSSPTSTFHG